MNKIVLIGRLTKDVELSTLSNERATSMCKFSLAVQNGRKDNNSKDYHTDFFNCVSFGKTAEIISKFCVKGNKIAVVGEMTSKAYIDKNGVNKLFWEVNVDTFDFVETKGKSENANEPFTNTGKQDLADDDLPF